MSELILHGSPVSPYVRATRIALIEKGAAYHFNEIGFDHLATNEYAELNPFQKMPVLQQENFVLYETSAILGYIEELFDKVSLQPNTAQARAHMWKWIGIASHYFYPVGITQLFVQQIMLPIMGSEADEVVVEKAVKVSAQHLDVLEQELTGSFLVGNGLSLADITVGVMVSYIGMTKEGNALISSRPKTAAWLSSLSKRDSFQHTLADLLVSQQKHE
ncbi:MAG: glutathione S-transferase family protein [Anaerolineae bacterium]|nr:glutathione S-transferase family protein [Gloeobacterales cyanobacterium ES-bin-313]